ncbi:MAG TPA: ATP-dependent 6-phosphofructokinase, partial [Thermodesulfatator atlanticus]|nr:ATP-dependent 6-phosphofructokinase [Thermodesulfatator atlanticus]
MECQLELIEEIPAEELDLSIETLGACKVENPLQKDRLCYVTDDMKASLVVSEDYLKKCLEEGRTPPSAELAGPRPRIYFDPAKTRAAIVTCGGLCPGINDVIRSIVLTLYFSYGV